VCVRHLTLSFLCVPILKNSADRNCTFWYEKKRKGEYLDIISLILGALFYIGFAIFGKKISRIICISHKKIN